MSNGSALPSSSNAKKSIDTKDVMKNIVYINTSSR